MSFTDQKPRTATEEDLKARWGGAPEGRRFRCYLCGHKFAVGDVWRWVYGANRTWTDSHGFKWGVPNFLVCGKCDGDDVLDKWVAQNEEAEKRFWWCFGF